MADAPIGSSPSDPIPYSKLPGEKAAVEAATPAATTLRSLTKSFDEGYRRVKQSQEYAKGDTSELQFRAAPNSADIFVKVEEARGQLEQQNPDETLLINGMANSLTKLFTLIAAQVRHLAGEKGDYSAEIAALVQRAMSAVDSLANVSKQQESRSAVEIGNLDKEITEMKDILAQSRIGQDADSLTHREELQSGTEGPTARGVEDKGADRSAEGGERVIPTYNLPRTVEFLRNGFSGLSKTLDAYRTQGAKGNTPYMAESKCKNEEALCAELVPHLTSAQKKEVDHIRQEMEFLAKGSVVAFNRAVIGSNTGSEQERMAAQQSFNTQAEKLDRRYHEARLKLDTILQEVATKAN